MKEIKLNVDGMMCEGCKKRIENALSEITGIDEVIADYNAGTVEIKATESVAENEIKEKIEDLGFSIIS